MAALGTVLTCQFQEKWEEKNRHEYLEEINNAIKEIKALDTEGAYAQRTLGKLEELKQWVWDDIIEDDVIEHNGEMAGIICGSADYIDCVYIKPEHRRKGLASVAVKEYVRESGAEGVRLHILNNNDVALRFWNGLFRLSKIEENTVDTLYEIIGVKF